MNLEDRQYDFEILPCGCSSIDVGQFEQNILARLKGFVRHDDILEGIRHIDDTRLFQPKNVRSAVEIILEGVEQHYVAHLEKKTDFFPVNHFLFLLSETITQFSSWEAGVLVLHEFCRYMGNEKDMGNEWLSQMDAICETCTRFDLCEIFQGIFSPWEIAHQLHTISIRRFDAKAPWSERIQQQEEQRRLLQVQTWLRHIS